MERSSGGRVGLSKSGRDRGDWNLSVSLLRLNNTERSATIASDEM